MTEQQTQPSHSPAPRYLQFIATAVGFCVSTYFVSTIVFNIGGPEQTMSAGYRWAIGGFALLYTVSMVVILGLTREGGYRAYRIEGGTLLLLKSDGGPVVARVELAAIESVDTEGVHEPRPDQEDVPTERENPAVLIRAHGKAYKLHAATAAQAREIATTMKSGKA